MIFPYTSFPITILLPSESEIYKSLVVQNANRKKKVSQKANWETHDYQNIQQTTL